MARSARNTVAYKNTNAHRVRTMTTESNFNQGMKYTTSPLEEGFAKLLVNYELKDDGNKLVPRGAEQLQYVTEKTNATNQMILAVGDIYITANEDAVTVRAALIGSYNDGIIDNIGIAYEYESKLYYRDVNIEKIVDDDSTYVPATLVAKEGCTRVHGINLENPTYSTPYGILEGNLYTVGLWNNVPYLCELVIEHNTSTDYRPYLRQVVPYEVAPAQAINFGYNMLKANPYTFSNGISPYNDIQLTGVVPYDTNDNLLLSARPGTEIKFKLSYKYPQQDLTNNDKYYVQWEIQDNDAGTNPQVITPWYASPVYTPGDAIAMVYAPTITNFSLIVKVYRKSEVDAQKEEWDENSNLQAVCSKNDFVTPAQVTVLASYYLASSDNANNRNVDAVNYALSTAKGMCMWCNRLVLWGVYGADSAIFVSDVNRPDYFPFPNNSDIFDSEVLNCIPYLTEMLVFTRNSIYKCTLNEDGIGFNSRVVQANIHISADDAACIESVQNMVYFRSSDSYYMIVPKYSVNTGEYGVSTAPISRPIQYLLENFDKCVREILTTVLDYAGDASDIDLTYNSAYSYVDGNSVHNVYNIIYNNNINCLLHLNYDTVLRTWYITLQQIDGDYNIHSVFIPNTAGHCYMLGLTADSVYTYYFDETNMVPNTTTPIVNGTVDFTNLFKYKARQCIITGYRNFSDELKKRFREMQFCVNTFVQNENIKFHTGFVVDDCEEKAVYTYELEYDDDSDSDSYGTAYVNRIYTDEVVTPTHTVLGMWELGVDKFTGTTMYKVRDHVTGKGYGGSYTIISETTVPYELLHISWVYRTMFAR